MIKETSEITSVSLSIQFFLSYFYESLSNLSYERNRKLHVKKKRKRKSILNQNQNPSICSLCLCASSLVSKMEYLQEKYSGESRVEISAKMLAQQPASGHRNAAKATDLQLGSDHQARSFAVLIPFFFYLYVY